MLSSSLLVYVSIFLTVVTYMFTFYIYETSVPDICGLLVAIKSL